MHASFDDVGGGHLSNNRLSEVSPLCILHIATIGRDRFRPDLITHIILRIILSWNQTKRNSCDVPAMDRIASAGILNALLLHDFHSPSSFSFFQRYDDAYVMGGHLQNFLTKQKFRYPPFFPPHYVLIGGGPAVLVIFSSFFKCVAWAGWAASF